MKSFLVPVAVAIAIVMGLIVCFVVIDRRDVNSFDGILAVQSTPPRESASFSVPETKSVTEVRPVESKPVAEVKPTTEVKPVTEDGPSEMKSEMTFVPVAVPVVSADEALKLNDEANARIQKLMEFAWKGMGLIYEDKLNSLSSISIEEEFDGILEKNKVSKSREELNTRKVPSKWSIDFNTLAGNCEFEQCNMGYRISSPDDFLRILAPNRAVMDTVTGISFELSCNTDNTHVKIGIEESGLIRPGKYYVTELSGVHEDECINIELTALEHFESISPFLEIHGDVTIHRLRIYQKAIKGVTHLEGLIMERSVLPDPEESDYPNCRFTVQFEGAVILDGEPVPKEIELIIEGFENYKVLATDRLERGNRVAVSIIPFEELPEEQQTTQQADDLNLFLLKTYYVANIKKINGYSDNPLMPKSQILFLDDNTDYVSVFERHVNPPISQELIDAQNKSIQEDLQKMNRLLRDYDNNKIQEINDRFLNVWEDEMKKDSNGYNRMREYVWRRIDDSFWCLPIRYNKLLPEPDMLTQNSLDCFSALKRACEANGVQLIVSIVPYFFTISARVINPEFRNIPDLQTAFMVKQLSEIGIETIYSADAIIQNYNRYPFAFFYPHNSHPSDTAQDVITDILSERLARYDFNQSLDSDLFSVRQYPHVYGNDPHYLFPENCDIGDNVAGQTYTNREILYNGEQIHFSKDAQMITIGNSFQQTPMDYPDSIPTLLSYKMNAPVDCYRIGGQGPFTDILIQILTRTDYFLKNKKVLIFYVGAEHIVAADRLDYFLNIAQLDKTRLALNGKTLITHFIPTSNTKNDSFRDQTIWGNLSKMDKSCFIVNENNESLCSLKLDHIPNSRIDDSKPITLIIPATAPPNSSCVLCIDNQSQKIQNFCTSEMARFFNLAFELPAGTKEIDIKAEGKNGTMFAIKDIQIWQ